MIHGRAISRWRGGCNFEQLALRTLIAPRSAIRDIGVLPSPQRSGGIFRADTRKLNIARYVIRRSTNIAASLECWVWSPLKRKSKGISSEFRYPIGGRGRGGARRNESERDGAHKARKAKFLLRRRWRDKRLRKRYGCGVLRYKRRRV